MKEPAVAYEIYTRSRVVDLADVPTDKHGNIYSGDSFGPLIDQGLTRIGWEVVPIDDYTDDRQGKFEFGVPVALSPDDLPEF